MPRPTPTVGGAMHARVSTLVVSWLAGLAGHHMGDYLVQRDCDAQRKQKHTPEGRKALARHAVTYGLTQAVARAVVYRVAGLRVPARAQVAGMLVETITHGVIDDGRAIVRFADGTGKPGFVRLGAPRDVSAVTRSGEPVHLKNENGDAVSWDNLTLAVG